MAARAPSSSAPSAITEVASNAGPRPSADRCWCLTYPFPASFAMLAHESSRINVNLSTALCPFEKFATSNVSSKLAVTSAQPQHKTWQGILGCKCTGSVTATAQLGSIVTSCNYSRVGQKETPVPKLPNDRRSIAKKRSKDVFSRFS